MSQSSSSSIVLSGVFTAPGRPEAEAQAEAKKRGRPTGSTSWRPTLKAGNKSGIVFNGTFTASYNWNIHQWTVTGQGSMGGLLSIVQAGQEAEKLMALPPIHADTESKWITMLFGEAANLTEVQKQAAHNFIVGHLTDPDIYKNWLVQKTGEVNPKVTKTVTDEDKAKALASMLCD